MTVTGMARPSSAYTWVMPTLRPMIPCTDISVASSSALATTRDSAWRRPLLGVLLAESLDLHVHPRGQVQLHESVHRLRSGLEDVEEPLVGADLKLLPALLVHVRRAEGRPAILDRGQGDRSRHPRPCPLGGVHDLACGLVQDPIVIGLEPDPDLLVQHHDWFTRLPFVRPTPGSRSRCPRPPSARPPGSRTAAPSPSR